MHEASITSSIIDSVLETLREDGITGTVTAVHVTVGVCQGLVPESMQLYFDMEKPGTPLEHSTLAVTVQGMVARCASCAKNIPLDIPVMFCPWCGAAMDLVHGKEIVITGIEVEDEHPPE
jgi:hydrogenase nickel incorporation protein HypA/HybF